MKIRKKLVNVFILLSMVLSIVMIPKDIYAAEDTTKYSFGHFYYHMHDGYVSICGYLGRETEVEIPSSIAGKPVAEIEAKAFEGCNNIETVIIPDTVVMVYQDSFVGADSLKKIISSTVGVEIQADSEVAIEYTNNIEQNDENTKSDVKSNSPDDEHSNNPEIDDYEYEETDSQSGVTDNVYDSNILYETDGILIEDSDIKVTVDDNGYLIQIDSNGNITTLDTSNKYQIVKNEDGKDEIVEKNGRVVEVTENGNVIFDFANREEQLNNTDNKKYSLTKYLSVGIVVFVMLLLFGVNVMKKRRK